MINLGAKPGVRGAGHIILQILRPLTIITLLAIATSSWVMIVFSGLNRQFSFFDTMSHAFISAAAVSLVISELDMFGVTQRYFEKNWPVFAIDHSLGWLGMLTVVLGCQLLSSLEKAAFSQASIGMPMWRLVLASGVLGLTFGFLNGIASIIFRDGKNGITARAIRRDGNLAGSTQNNADVYDKYSSHDNYSTSSREPYPAPLRVTPQRSLTTMRHEEEEVVDDVPENRRITKIFNIKNYRTSKLKISKPYPHQGGVQMPNEDDFRHDRASPIMPSLQRPPTALHPMHTGGSHYSVAHIGRFPEDDDTVV